MNKDASPTAASQTGDGVITRVVGCKRCFFTLLPGAIMGMLVGILNFVALHNHWKLQDDFFDIVDAPIHSLFFPSYPSGSIRSLIWIFRIEGRTALVIICYWTLIGVFLASLLCLVRRGVIRDIFLGGVIRDIVRDKICRWALFFGACGGILIGSLGFLAASNGWDELGNLFESFNHPVNYLIDVLQDRFQVLDSLPHSTATEFVCRHVAGVVYWMMIGLLLASLFCVARILGKRTDARIENAPTRPRER